MTLKREHLEDNTLPRRGRAMPHSPLSNKPTQPGDIRIPLDSRFAIYVRAMEWRAVSTEEREAMLEQWRDELPAIASKIKSEDELTPPPVYEDMPLAELRVLAAERGLDQSGGAKALAARLRASDVAARFGSAPKPETPSESEGA